MFSRVFDLRLAKIPHSISCPKKDLTGPACASKRCAVWRDTKDWLGFVEAELAEQEYKEYFIPVSEGGTGRYEILIVKGREELDRMVHQKAKDWWEYCMAKKDSNELKTAQLCRNVLGIDFDIQFKIFSLKWKDVLMSSSAIRKFCVQFLALHDRYDMKIDSPQYILEQHLFHLIGFGLVLQYQKRIESDWKNNLLEHLIFCGRNSIVPSFPGEAIDNIESFKFLSLEIQHYLGYEGPDKPTTIKRLIETDQAESEVYTSLTGKELLTQSLFSLLKAIAEEKGPASCRVPFSVQQSFQWQEEKSQHGFLHRFL
eukprot:GHVP01006340.1.p1 GENE.GHVP01006340.1~~GHVP01006340.1.p1  ORF type:complete len:313 (-),score=65.61 GHVP01006340.1:451-1389(-)